MDDVAVLIPFASTCKERQANLATVQDWYSRVLPGVPQIVADDGGCRAGWTKAYAVERAMAQTDARVLVVADSDCLCDAVPEAVEAVRSGGFQWAFPHTQIRRLDIDATAEVRAGAQPTEDMPLEFKPYAGVAGGGICVVTRDAWAEAPMDPRFKVTHGEDVAWARAMDYLCGRPWHPKRGAARRNSPLYHLHHPPILAVGSRYKANEKIARMYDHATSLTIRQVLADGQAHQDPPPVEPLPSTATVAVIVPVLRRPWRAEPFMESWRASNPAGSAVYAVTDAEDRATRQAWFDAGAIVLTSDRGSTYAQKVNYGLEATVEPWLLLVGDDVKFHEGWLEAALEAGQHADVVSTNDMARTDLDELAVHPMFSRRYLIDRGASLDGPGLICHEGYKHWYVDNEWSFLARERGVMTYAAGARIEHLHPIFRKGETDEVYELGQSHAYEDSRLWILRKNLYARRVVRSPHA